MTEVSVAMNKNFSGHRCLNLNPIHPLQISLKPLIRSCFISYIFNTYTVPTLMFPIMVHVLNFHHKRRDGPKSILWQIVLNLVQWYYWPYEI